MVVSSTEITASLLNFIAYWHDWTFLTFSRKVTFLPDSCYRICMKRSIYYCKTASEMNKYSKNDLFMRTVKLLADSMVLNGSAEIYVCDYCGRKYNRKDNLQQHRRLECGKEPQCQCPYCPHRTKRIGNLRAHMRLKHPFQATHITSLAETVWTVLCLYQL